MNNRLSSESIITNLDSGIKSLAWKSDSREMIFQESIDLNAILARDNANELIQSVDRRAIYLALVSADQEVALEVLPHLSQEQWTAIVDYEGWNEQAQTLSIHNISRWLNLYGQISSEQLFQRYQQLDEEYQIGVLSKLIRLADEEEYEKLSHDEQDKFRALPCNTLWYSIDSTDNSIISFVNDLIAGGLGENVEYLYSLLNHACYLPPNEDEARLIQFRNARLEEDGFALYDDSLSLFARQDLSTLRAKYGQGDKTDSSAIATIDQSGNLLLTQIFKKIQSSGSFDFESENSLKISLFHVANMAASACQISPDDHHGLKELSEQCYKIVNLGLSALSGRDETKAIDILMIEGPKVLFQYGLSLVDDARENIISKLKEINLDFGSRIERNYNNRKFGAILWNIDTLYIDLLGLECCETLKGLFNRLPMAPIQRLNLAEKITFAPISSLAELMAVVMAIEAMLLQTSLPNADRNLESDTTSKFTN